MKQFLVAAVLLPALSLAQGVTRPRAPEDILLPWGRQIALGSGTGMGARQIPAPFLVTGASIQVGTGSGGGAGTTVISVCVPGSTGSCTGGTTLCTLTLACATSQNAGVYWVASSATCAVPTGLVTAQVTTAGCTSTQPTAVSVHVQGRWL